MSENETTPREVTPRELRARLERSTADDRPDLLDTLALLVASDTPGAAEELAWAVRHFRLAHPALRNYLLSESDIDAAEQATLVAVAYRMGSFRGESRFTTWLHQVATNEARQLIRAEQRHAARAESGDAEEYADQFVGRVSSMLADQRVVQAEIARLTENHRQALLLREEQGLPYEAIADQLGVPLSTAKTWVRRGRAELADRLRDQFHPE